MLESTSHKKLPSTVGEEVGSVRMLVVVGAGTAELVLVVLKIVLRQARPLRHSRHRPEEVDEHVGGIQHKNLFEYYRGRAHAERSRTLVPPCSKYEENFMFVTEIACATKLRKQVAQHRDKRDTNTFLSAVLR